MCIELREEVAKLLFVKRSASAPPDLCMPTEIEIKKELEANSNESDSLDEQL